jgi:hypothetical protein
VRRNTLLIAILAVLLACPAAAFARGGGHNTPTKKLEAAFTAALTARITSANGCYPAPSPLARAIRQQTRLRVGVARGVGSARVPGVVYVLRRGSSCNNARMVLRHKGDVYRLDSTIGEVKVLGTEAARARRRAAIRGNRGPLRAVKLVSSGFPLTPPHRRVRFEAHCPGKSFPLSGGVTSNPGLGADGEGIYPHSFERLGAQRGWHVSAWLFDPSGGGDARRSVIVQALCGKGLVPMSAPHTTVFLKPGETKTVVARCPRGQYLMSGGFQRTDFLHSGGDYVTESRAVGPQAWQVTGHAYGEFGGELTSIAYCVKSRGPLLEEVSASAPLPFGASATATTPPCPPGRVLTLGGFSANGSQDTFFAGGTINDDNTWSARSYGRFGSAPSLTAYGYCVRPGAA